MSVEFVKVKSLIDGMQRDCLVRRGSGVSLGGVTCTSHCQLFIDGAEFTVLWQFSSFNSEDHVQEKENQNCDSNAVAVFMQTSDNFEVVGYIASELTQYVIHYMDEPNFYVSVKNIRFRTTYMMVGFYATVELTKGGLWDEKVIKASKNIK